MNDVVKALEVYTLEEILEFNNITHEEILEYLLEKKMITLPERLPLDFED